MSLLPVKEARKRILATAKPLENELVSLAKAGDRVLAEDLTASRDQPPFSASAMDGYAVRHADIATLPCRLTIVGEAAAGHAFGGSIGAGECVRIFTGAPVPDGADSVVIQENTVPVEKDRVQINKGEAKGRYVRSSGLDFKAGETRLHRGRILDAGALSLAAAMNIDRLPVIRKPRVAIIATGDELVFPGSKPAADQIIASSSFGVADLVRRAGGEPTDLGIATDSVEALSEKFNQTGCVEADIVITLGGASVGDHDLVRDALAARKIELDFWKLAMRPGKPVMFGIDQSRRVPVHVIGLPGNPVSSLVCTEIFIKPLIRKMLGLPTQTNWQDGVLGIDIPANDEREEYMRARLEQRDGRWVVTPFDSQDSSIISLYDAADCLMLRPASGPQMPAGSPCQFLPLGNKFSPISK